MKLLLDECVTRFLKRDLVGHEVSTVAEVGFRGLKNGALLQAASEAFDVLITVDRNLPFQQNINTLPIAVLLLIVTSTKYPDLKSLAPDVLTALQTIQPGELRTVQK